MIIIGDVHGMYDKLMKLVDKLPNKQLCFVGDLIDRGPDSKKVVDFVINNNHKCVMGNHEDFLNSSLKLNNENEIVEYCHIMGLWIQNGGSITIDSFNGIPGFFNYLEWFKSLPFYIIYKDFLISHSFAYNGIETDKYDILWNRYLEKTSIKDNYRNIYGHTPHKTVTKYGLHYCIDTCAFHKDGYLSALDLDTMKIYNSKE